MDEEIQEFELNADGRKVKDRSGLLAKLKQSDKSDRSNTLTRSDEQISSKSGIDSSFPANFDSRTNNNNNIAHNHSLPSFLVNFTLFCWISNQANLLKILMLM